MTRKEPPETERDEIAIKRLAGLDAKLREDPAYGVLVGILVAQLAVALGLRVWLAAALAGGALVGVMLFSWWGLVLAVFCLGQVLYYVLTLSSPSALELLWLASAILALGLLLSRGRRYE